MKKLILLITIICYFTNFNVVAQISSDTTKKTIESDIGKTPITTQLQFPDTIQIRNIVATQSSQSSTEKNMPWIVALFIGLFSAFINYLISRHLRKSNEKSLERQFENSKENSLIQFKATIAAKNRQDWINELRHTLSEFLSYASLVSNFNADLNEKSDIHVYLQKILYAKAKIELLVNKEKEEQKHLVEKMEELFVAITGKKSQDDNEIPFRKARTEVIKAANQLFNLHWKKIKDLK